MEVTQVYVFSGPGSVKKANEFLKQNFNQMTIDPMTVFTSKEHIAIVAGVRWAMCDVIWQSYEEIVKG